MPAKGGGLLPHSTSREAALAWARSTFSDEVWQLLVEACDDLEQFGQGPEAVATVLARRDAAAVQDDLGSAAALVDRAAEVADQWEIPPFEPLNVALASLQEAMAQARSAARLAIEGAVEADIALQFGDEWPKLHAVMPPPTKGLNDLPEKTARRQNFVRLASLKADLNGCQAAEWALVAVALGIDEPPAGVQAVDQWDRLRRLWSSALASVRSK